MSPEEQTLGRCVANSVGETGIFKFPHESMLLCWQGGLWQVFLSLSYLFWCGYFLVCLMCRRCSASFWISFRGNCSVCSCRFGVFVGGDEFRGLLYYHLGLEICESFVLYISSNLENFQPLVYQKIFSAHPFLN